MRDPISIRSFISAIRGLPSDPPVRSNVWYLTQKEHWLGWLSEYEGRGAYGRQVGIKRDARFAYNHSVNYQMLLYLAKAAGVDRKLVAAATRASGKGATLMYKAGAVRAIVPWAVVAAALWPRYSSARTPPQ